MSDDSANKPPSSDGKPRKEPKIWPGRAAAVTPAASETPAPPTQPETGNQPAAEPPAAAQGAVPASETTKKQPKIWKGRSGGAAAGEAAPKPAPTTVPAARTSAGAAPSTPAKTIASAKPPVPLVPVPKKPEIIESEQRIKQRRRFAISFVFTFLTANLLMFMRFFFPRVLFEPKTVFKIGYPTDFAFGVETKYQKDYRIWVVRNSEGIFAIYARCTHLGCTPDWISSENKFKCPCHGSGYDSEGINFEGPAPRPLDRAKVEVDSQGQIVVDTSKLYQWPKGAKSEFKDSGAFLPV